MKIRLAGRLAIVLTTVAAVFSPCLACDSTKTYPIAFVCEPDAGSECPSSGDPCPDLPLGSDNCGDLPGLFGHPTTPVTTGRPIGCAVGLPYGNPYYGDQQEWCYCELVPSSPSATTPGWLCPL